MGKMPDIYVSPKTKKAPKKEKLVEKKTNPLSAFAPVPDGVRFETQELEEKIVLLLRMHWITNVPWILLAVVFLLAPLALSFFPLLGFLPSRFQIMAVILWYLLAIAYIFEQFLTWFFNVYIITDERIVDIDFFNLLYKEVSDAKIDKIQDVTYKMGGVVRALFNYGDVYIQTAGTEPNFVFEAVPKPDKVARILQELRTQEEIEVLEGRIR